MTGSPRRGRYDAEGPEKRGTPVMDPFVGDGAERSPVSLGNSFLCSALMSGRGSRIRISVRAQTTQEIAILQTGIMNILRPLSPHLTRLRQFLYSVLIIFTFLIVS